MLNSILLAIIVIELGIYVNSYLKSNSRHNELVNEQKRGMQAQQKMVEEYTRMMKEQEEKEKLKEKNANKGTV